MSLIPQDKLQHLLMGVLVGLMFGARPIMGLLAAMIVGISKEIYDYIYNKTIAKIHSVEVLDAASTIVGGVIGVSLMQLQLYLVDYIL